MGKAGEQMSQGVMGTQLPPGSINLQQPPHMVIRGGGLGGTPQPPMQPMPQHIRPQIPGHPQPPLQGPPGPSRPAQGSPYAPPPGMVQMNSPRPHMPHNGMSNVRSPRPGAPGTPNGHHNGVQMQMGLHRLPVTHQAAQQAAQQQAMMQQGMVHLSPMGNSFLAQLKPGPVLPLCPLPAMITDFFDRQVDSVKEFCALQKERVDLIRTYTLTTLEAEHAQMVQEQADLDYELASADTRRIDGMLAKLEASRADSTGTLSRASSITTGSSKMSDSASPRASVI